jgi:hypothetical protein
MADKISLEDVVKVLVKHAGTPNDPDDAATLTAFNEQQTEKQEEEPKSVQPKGRS